jgi:hypothetical protein
MALPSVLSSGRGLQINLTQAKATGAPKATGGTESQRILFGHKALCLNGRLCRFFILMQK